MCIGIYIYRLEVFNVVYIYTLMFMHTEYAHWGLDQTRNQECIQEKINKEASNLQSSQNVKFFSSSDCCFFFYVMVFIAKNKKHFDIFFLICEDMRIPSWLGSYHRYTYNFIYSMRNVDIYCVAIRYFFWNIPKM